MVVVDLGCGTVKLAGSETAGEAVRFRGMTSVPLGLPGQDDDQIDEYDLIASHLREEVARQGWAGMPAACLLSGSVTSTQSFIFPAMSDAELRQAIQLKLSDTLHFDVDEASFDFRRVQEFSQDGSNKVLTLVTAARVQEVLRALNLLREAGLEPVAVSAAAESLANLAYHARLCSESESTIHIDIGDTSTILNLFAGRVLRFSREIDIANGTFIEALLRPILTDGGQVTLTRGQAEEVMAAAGYLREDDLIELPLGLRAIEIVPLLEPISQRLTHEIERSVDYMRGLIGGAEIDTIVVSGPGSRMRNLASQLHENLGFFVVSMDPVARAAAHWRLSISDGDGVDTSGFSAILGYALGAVKLINLVPAGERAKIMLGRFARMRKIVVPTVAAGSVCIAIAGIPIKGEYDTAHTSMVHATAVMRSHLAGEQTFTEQRAEALSKIAGITTARGPVPDWVGVMKEIAHHVPEEMEILGIHSTRKGDVHTIHLSARIGEGRAPFQMTVTQLTVALGDSPFFERVRISNAAIDADGVDGRLEVSLDVVADTVLTEAPGS